MYEVKEMKTIYDAVADEYIKYRNDLPEMLLPGLEARGIDFNGAKIADFGAGPGFFSEQLSEKGGIVDAVEPSMEFYNHAEMRFKDNNKVNFNLASAENSGLPPKTFDIVISLRSWDWFDRREALEEVQRILKPDGHLVIADFGFVSSSGVGKESVRVMRKCAKSFKVKSKIHKQKNDELITGFPLEWIEEWQKYHFDIQDLYKRSYKMEFTHEEWIDHLSPVSTLVEFKRKHRRRTLKKIGEHLKDKYDDDTYRVAHEMNVAILKNRS